MTTEPTTDAGRRLLRMFETTEGPRHTRWPRAFDARLAERIVEEFVPMIEAECYHRNVVDSRTGPDIIASNEQLPASPKAEPWNEEQG